MGTARGSARLLVALFGPTSSGKTRLSIELCLRMAADTGLEPVVVSADSRQVYRYMDIGTSKTTASEMRGIRHEMLSVADPASKYELESYVTAARGHIDDCWSRGGVPVIVGGTAVYVKALLEGWSVDRTAATLASLRRDFPRGMGEDAYATLRRLDRSAAARVHPNNYDGVINALAAAMTRPEGTRQAKADTADAANLRTVVLGLDRPARELDSRVARTFDNQMEGGLLDEVQSLSARYDLESRRRANSNNQALHTHGYREFFDVAGERGKPLRTLSSADLDVIRERVVAHIQAYTRRQRGAFRKLPGVRMIRSTDHAYQAVRPALRA
jgi:tRNA dimethylallyltransferase